MKGETAEQVAERMRAIAASMSGKGDAAEIVRYADCSWGADIVALASSRPPWGRGRPTLRKRQATSPSSLY
jgi:hypothetical protein